MTLCHGDSVYLSLQLLLPSQTHQSLIQGLCLLADVPSCDSGESHFPLFPVFGSSGTGERFGQCNLTLL